MNLEKLIQGAPGSNAAFILPDSSTLDGLIEQCRLVGKTGYIDVKKVNVASLIRQFSEYEIVVLTNLENLNDKHELLYCLSCLLDLEEPYVMCIVNEKNKFIKLQYDHSGPLYLRWFWFDDFGRFLSQSSN